LAVIEVKARDSLAVAAEAVSPRQRARIAGAARLFLSRHPRFAGHSIRFDIMLVMPRRWPRHVVGAWYVDGVR
jgi:putative endonuclease